MVRFLLALLLIAAPAPAVADVAPHSGVARPRTHPEPSDIALFVMAGVGIWLVRRALVKRFDRDE